MKHIRITAAILLVQTLVWVLLLILSTAAIEPGWGDAEFVRWAAERGVAYILNYINVTLLTLVVVVFFSFLYHYLKETSKDWALAALVLVPVYGVLNLVAYSIQISVVPEMAVAALVEESQIPAVARMIQVNPDSPVGFANGLAYAILGVSSIIYGRLLMFRKKKLSGVLLLINGILCILGITGYLIGSDLLGAGVMLGGVLFLFSLAAMVREFRPGG